MVYEVKSITQEDIAEIKAKYPMAEPKAYAAIEPTPRNPQRPYEVLGYYGTEAEAQQSVRKWEARDKVADLTEDMDIFDTIWIAVKESGLDEEEVMEIIKNHI